MEDRTDTHSLYVLVVSLLGTVISCGLVHHRSRLRCSWSGCVRSCTGLRKVPALYLFLGFSMSWLLTSTLVIGYSVL